MNDLKPNPISSFVTQHTDIRIYEVSPYYYVTIWDEQLGWKSSGLLICVEQALDIYNACIDKIMMMEC
jgi:hypothetical protein